MNSFEQGNRKRISKALAEAVVLLCCLIGCSTYVGNPDGKDPAPIGNVTPAPVPETLPNPGAPPQSNNEGPKSFALATVDLAFEDALVSISTPKSAVKELIAPGADLSEASRERTRKTGTHDEAIDLYLRLVAHAKNLVMPASTGPSASQGAAQKLDCSVLSDRWSLLYAVFCGSIMASIEKLESQVAEFNMQDGSSALALRFGGSLPDGVQTPLKPWVFKNTASPFPLYFTAWRDSNKSLAATGLGSLIAQSSREFEFHLDEESFGRRRISNYTQRPLKSVNGCSSVDSQCYDVRLKYASEMSSAAQSKPQVTNADLRYRKLKSDGTTAETLEGVYVFDPAVAGFWQIDSCVQYVYWRLFVSDQTTFTYAKPQFLATERCLSLGGQLAAWAKKLTGDDDRGFCRSLADGGPIECSEANRLPLDVETWLGADAFMTEAALAELKAAFPSPPEGPGYRTESGAQLKKIQSAP